MTLYQIFILAAILCFISVILLITLAANNVSMAIAQSALKQQTSFAESAHMETAATNVTKVNQLEKKVAKKTSRKKALTLVSLTFLSACFCAMLAYSIGNHVALRHGAFGDYQHTSTLATVFEKSKHMFEDQSEKLPDDLSGSILVFFKYTCDDCYDTHDQIMNVLEREGIDNVWFISTASEKGAEMIEPYGVKAVPWAVYVAEDGSVGATDIIYDEFTKEPAEKFKEANLMAIINAQKGTTE